MSLKEFLRNPQYQKQRQESLSKLDINAIDIPITELIKVFSLLTHCFTLQCCYGHFLYDRQKNPESVDPLPISKNIGNVEYRIAYLALCIQNNDSGKRLFSDLRKIQEIDPDHIQFGCAEWFWRKQVNSFVLQVEPERFKTKDSAVVPYSEALHIEKVRNKFFDAVRKII